MANFANSFFTIAGQKERLQNVGSTLLAAVGLKEGGVISNTGVKKVDAVLGAAASHPFVTAGVVAGGMAAAGAKAPTAFQAVVTPIAKATGAAVAKAPLKSAAVGIVGLTVLKSEKGREAVANAPASVSSFTTNAAALIDNPSIEKAKKLVKEDPVLTGLVGAGGLVAIGAAGRGVASIVTTQLNTEAVKANTAIATAGEAVSSVTGKSSAEKALLPETTSTKQNVAPPVDSSLEQPAEATPAEIPRSGNSTGVKNTNKVNILIANQTKSTRNRNIYISKRSRRR